MIVAFRRTFADPANRSDDNTSQYEKRLRNIHEMTLFHDLVDIALSCKGTKTYFNLKRAQN